MFECSLKKWNILNSLFPQVWKCISHKLCKLEPYLEPLFSLLQSLYYITILAGHIIKVKCITCSFESMNVITRSTFGFSALFAVVLFFIWIFILSFFFFFFFLSGNRNWVKSFFWLDERLWLFINLMSLKHYLVS